MIELLEIQQKLQDTQAAIAKTQKAISENPQTDSLIVNLRGLQNRSEYLEKEFLEAASRVEADVLRGSG